MLQLWQGDKPLLHSKFRGGISPSLFNKAPYWAGEKMKQIKLKELISGRRAGMVQMGGFELQAPKSASMKEEGYITRKGELSLNFKVTIPPSGLFSIPDTQHNRVKLRLMVVEQKRNETFHQYDHKEKKMNTNEQVLTLRPAMEILNEVDIYKDLFVPKTLYTEEEMEALIKERMKKGSKKKVVKKVPKKGQEIQEVPEEDLTPEQPPKAVDKWANKAPAVGEIVTS